MNISEQPLTTLGFTFLWSINVCLLFLFTSMTEEMLYIAWTPASFPATLSFHPPHAMPSHAKLLAFLERQWVDLCIQMMIPFRSRVQVMETSQISALIQQHTTENVGTLLNLSGPGAPCSPAPPYKYPLPPPGARAGLSFPSPQGGLPSTLHTLPSALTSACCRGQFNCLA